MKFPIQHCLHTSLLTQEMYSELICKMVTEGYVNTISNLQIVSLVKMWGLIGVNQQGDILLYDNNTFYLEVDSPNRNNILNEEWLERYLK